MTESSELKLVKPTAERTSRVRKENIEKLKMVEAHKLTNLILADFTEKQMQYREYAAYATEQLGFPVTGAQVATRVKQFEVPHGDKPQVADPSEYTAMLLRHEVEIQDLKERLTLLEAWVNTTFPTRSGKKTLN
jgi:hypothetical protein